MTIRALIVDTIGTVICIAAALMLGGCGTEKPCQNPVGRYCDGPETLCLNGGVAVTCAETTGGVCGDMPTRNMDGTLVGVPECLANPQPKQEQTP